LKRDFDFIGREYFFIEIRRSLKIKDWQAFGKSKKALSRGIFDDLP
jgi:hypothetical protein